MRLSFRDLRKANEAVSLHEELSLPRVPQENTQVSDISPVQCDVVAELTGHLLHVHGTAKADITYTCSRCLEPLCQTLNAVIDERFTDDASSGDDDDLHVVTADELDFTPYVEQAVNLELDYRPVCSDQCLGLCPVCGCNRNQTACNCETKPIDPRFEALQDLLSSDKSK